MLLKMRTWWLIEIIEKKDHFNNSNFSSLSFLKIIYLFLAALGLYCRTQAFSSCGEWGLGSSCCGLLC